MTTRQASVFRLIAPTLPRQLAHGCYRRVGGDDAPRDDDVVIDHETGRVWGATGECGTDLLRALDLGPLRDALADGPCPILFEASAPYDPSPVLRRLGCRVMDHHPGLVESMTLPQVIAVLIDALAVIGDDNARRGVESLANGRRYGIATSVGSIRALRTMPIEIGRSYRIDYTNYEGKRGQRDIEVLGMSYGANAYHPRDGLMILGRDIARGVVRTFTTDARSTIHSLMPIVSLNPD